MRNWIDRKSALRVVVLLAAFALPLTGGLLGARASAEDALHFMRGDANADGRFDVSDPIRILTYLFLSEGAIPCLDAADGNDSGEVNVLDALFLLEGLFGGGPSPPPPSIDECGVDPTADALGCGAYPLCLQPVAPVPAFAADITTGEAPLTVTFDASASVDPDGQIVLFAWDYGDGFSGLGIATAHTYATTGEFTATLTVTDNTGVAASTSTIISVTGFAPVRVDHTSPPDGDSGVAITREVIVYFTAPVLATSISPAAISAAIGTRPIDSLLHFKPGEESVTLATLFFAPPLPASTQVTVTVNGDLLLDTLGRAVDADGDGTPGGVMTFRFVTLSLTPVPGTVVVGRLFASEFAFTHANEPLNVPLTGATITVDGIDPSELSSVVDKFGNYRLEPVPAGQFFVHIDGRTVTSVVIEGETVKTSFPDGTYYPFVGKTFSAVAGRETQMMDIYLPRVEVGALQAVSATEDTVLCFSDEILEEFPELAGACITVAADSLYADDGTRGGMVGISPVSPDRLPGPLPADLQFSIVITVQTSGGTNFDVPAALCLPNLPNPATGEPLPPGSLAGLWSFNHDSGVWEVVGTMTVTADGTLVCTDPGVGILAPGWHGVNPGGTLNGGPLERGDVGDRGDPGPESGETGKDDGDGDSDCPNGGKVMLETGEEIFERVDLAIPGRGDIHFVMARTYRSKLALDGPLGYGWDFSYNEYLFPNPNGDITRLNGRGRIKRWRAFAAVFENPTGSFSGLKRNPSETYEVRSPNGFIRRYDRYGRVIAHVDRYGNSMLFQYDGQNRLDLVVDAYGREVEFFYATAPDGKSRLARIRDFAGREVRYTYDALGDLIEVRTPVVVGTSTGNDFPEGRVERYTYSSGFAIPELNHNILSVTYPEEVANGGPPALTWEYGEDPTDVAHFDKVIAEHEGGGRMNASGIPAGGTTLYTYEPLNQSEPPGDLSLPRGRAIETDRNGNRIELYGNELHQHVMTRFYTRGVRDGEPEYYETKSEYDNDGQLTRRILPEGNEVRYAYEATTRRASQENLVEIREIADAARGGGEDLVTRMTYEPLYNQLASITDPRGNAEGYAPPIGTASAERYTTRYLFDYQEGSTASILALADKLDVNLDPDGIGPITAESVAAGLSKGRDLNGDGRTNQTAGSVVRIEAPAVTLVPGSNEAARIGSETQQIVTLLQWNDRGQVLRAIDPEGNVVVTTYHLESDPDGDSHVGFYPWKFLPPLPGGGYPASVTVDAEDWPTRSTAAAPAALKTSFAYDPVGNTTAVTNPRGITTTTEFNALNEPVRSTHGADIALAVFNGELAAETTPLAFDARLFYDHNGRVIRREVENRDVTTPGVGQFIESTSTYDLLNHALDTTVEVDAATTLKWQQRYDPFGLPTLKTEPEGNQTAFEYDERNLIFRATAGAGSPEAATIRYDYDRNANLVRVFDAEDNNGDGSPESRVYTYDGFNRPVRVTDALGNRALSTYDVASNIVRTAMEGHPAAEPAADPVLLEETFYRHDELQRTFRTDGRLFLSDGYTTVRPVDLRDEDDDGFVTTHMEYDALSRPTFTVEDDLQVSETIYDGVSRVIESRDALGNALKTAYDRNSNAVRVTSTERATGLVVADEVFATTYVYDQLDRLVRATDNAGQTTRFAYDSRHNLIHRADPVGEPMDDPLGLFPAAGQTGQINAAGNTCSYVYDGLSRVVQEICDLRVGGTGAGALDLAEPTNPDGRITVAYRFDGNSRLVAIVDDKGNEAAFEYDALDQQTVKRNADDTEHLFSYDRDGNLASVTDPNGTVSGRTYDAMNRLIEVAVTRAPGVGGTTLATFQYDGLSRLTRATDDNGGGGIEECEYVYDSLSRLLEERQNGRAISNVYSGDGKRVSCTYPGGRHIEHTFDEIDRRLSTFDGDGDISAWSWIGPGLRELERVHGNGTRETYLNDAGDVAIGYDNVLRAVRLRSLLATGTPIVDREYTYNRASVRTSEERHDDGGLTDHYTYDSAYRIVDSRFDESGDAGAVPRDLTQRLYRLDGVGNRVTTADTLTSTGLVETAYTTNEMNEYTAVGLAARTHDENGNLTSDGTRELVYDYKNRLVAVEDLDGDPIAEYRYYSDNRRARKTVYDPDSPGDIASDTTFFYDGWSLCEEEDDIAGTSQMTYVWAPTYIDDLISFTRAADHRLGAGTFYAHQDARADVVAITDAAGDIAERFRYDDFGNADRTSATGNGHLFQGQRLDAETGFYYFRNRYYDPQTGRFLQRDPVWDPGNAANQYTFVGNGPSSGVDPLGLLDREYWKGAWQGFWYDIDRADWNQRIGAGAGAAVRWWGGDEPLIAATEAGVSTAFRRAGDLGDTGREIVEGLWQIAQQNPLDTLSQMAEVFHQENFKAMSRAAREYEQDNGFGSAALAYFGTLVSDASLATGMWELWTGYSFDDHVDKGKLRKLTNDEIGDLAAELIVGIGGLMAAMRQALAKTIPHSVPEARPEGVPENWQSRPTRGEGGTEYYNPQNPNETVRVMPGNPKSPYPNSQRPYVRQTDSSGSFLDAQGNRGAKRSAETHIPLDKFKFKKP